MANHMWGMISPRLREKSSNIAWKRRVRSGDPIEYSYSQIYAAALHIAGTLRDKGVTAGDVVSVSAPNGPEWGAAALGVFKIGAILAPIHVGYSKEDIARQIEALNPKIILIHDFSIDGCEVECLPIEMSDEGAEREANISENFKRTSEAVRIYTSGSTGTPKIVMLPHQAICSNLEACSKIVNIGTGDRFLSLLPLSHMFEMLGGMLLPLYNGATIVLPSVLAGDEVLKAMSEEGISIVIAVPRLYRSIKQGMEKRFDEAPAPIRWYVDFLSSIPLRWRKRLNGPLRKKLSPNLRFLVSGGARLDPEISGFFRSLGISLRQGYGLTETGPVVCVQDDFPKNLDSVGMPIEDVEVMVDRPDGQGCGEIQVRGPNVMLGYTDSELTAEVMNDGWFRTGDIGRIDASGELSITGRIKRIVVTEAGKNVYPEEIETLLERYPSVKEAAVFELNQRPAAVLAMDDENVSQARSVIDSFNKRTSSHNQISRFAVVGDLPKTPLGKPALTKLPEVFSENEQ